MNDDDRALVELDVLASTGPLRATPAALGITWPCVAGPVDAAIRFAAVQRVRRGVDIVDDRDVSGRSRFLPVRVHPQDDVVLADVRDVPHENLARSGFFCFRAVPNSHGQLTPPE